MFNQDPDYLHKKRPELTHSEGLQVSSHTQRVEGEWTRHTLMITGYDVPFYFLRKQGYKSLKGARINISYYPEEKLVAGMQLEMMKIVRIKRS